MSATNATTPCPDDDGGMSPPGDCTPDQHRSLQDNVNSACKSGKRACTGAQDCATLLANLEKNKECAGSRQTINNTCFRGGDAGHAGALTDALSAVAKCTKWIEQKCRPQPQPVPAPAPVPVEDPGFMDKMSKLTGLTGAALVLYLIVSEGSRLFPPRNLVPVP